MRSAVITTLKALYEGKEVTANKGFVCNTTRVANEIGTLRRDMGIDILTLRVDTDNGKWYGSYKLVRSKENLRRVREILKSHSVKDEVQES